MKVYKEGVTQEQIDEFSRMCAGSNAVNKEYMLSILQPCLEGILTDTDSEIPVVERLNTAIRDALIKAIQEDPETFRKEMASGMDFEGSATMCENLRPEEVVLKELSYEDVKTAVKFAIHMEQGGMGAESEGTDEAVNAYWSMNTELCKGNFVELIPLITQASVELGMEHAEQAVEEV